MFNRPFELIPCDSPINKYKALPTYDGKVLSMNKEKNYNHFPLHTTVYHYIAIAIINIANIAKGFGGFSLVN